MDFPNNISPRSRQMYAPIEKYQNSPFSQKDFGRQDDLSLSTVFACKCINLKTVYHLKIWFFLNRFGQTTKIFNLECKIIKYFLNYPL